MSKEAVAKLENEYKENIWKGSKSMIAYACHKISDCYETEKGYLIEFEKPSIKKDFCFGYDDFYSNQDDADEMAAHARTNERYFIEKNLEEINRLIKSLESGKVYARKGYDDSVNLRSLVFEKYLRTYEFEKEKCDELSGSDVAGLIEMAKNERRKFEKRLGTYLKRYGTSKLNIWTYYRD